MDEPASPAASEMRQWIYSLFTWFKDIDRWSVPFVPQEGVQTYVHKNGRDGRPTWEGGKDLKRSQAYTALFGANIQNLFELHRGDLIEWAQGIARAATETSICAEDWSGGDRWDDARLSPVFEWLVA